MPVDAFFTAVMPPASATTDDTTAVEAPIQSPERD
jgi:hypothetical protein